MIVVADTGPLHHLILVEHAELLHGLYGAGERVSTTCTATTCVAKPHADGSKRACKSNLGILRTSAFDEKWQH
jgi:hypothetical protein